MSSMPEKPDITLHLVADPGQSSVARALFREYQAEIGIDLSFQDFSAEVASLPGGYAPPRGRLYVVNVDGEPAGCIALRPRTGDVCEMKRLFVRARYRTLRLGRLLSEQLIADARSMGYARMVLDTLPSMQRAQSLYRSLGFKAIDPYTFNPVEGAVYMELKLNDPGTPSQSDCSWPVPGNGPTGIDSL